MRRIFRSRAVFAGAVLLAMSAASLAAEPDVATLRVTALDENDEAPRMMPEENTDLRKSRNYPEQPPIIPHKIEGYPVDMNVNKCLTCHARNAVKDSQAPMVSITHFMDRDGQFLASISPRRYFCNQCHVPQHEVKPLIGNDFVDVDTLITEGR